MTKHRYGWKPDKPDFRDKKYSRIHTAFGSEAPLPSHFSLREKMPEIMDQGDLGSCTACSISTAIMFERMRLKETPEFRPSELFIYYNERLLEGTVYSDAGAEIRSGIKSVTRDGVCAQKFWPYDVSKFKRKPNRPAYWNARKYKVIQYFRLDNSKIDDLKHCLFNGFPFIMGFTIFDSIEKADTNGGFIEMPTHDSSMDGGHAIVCCGYDDEKKVFQLHNTWGTEVADHGYYYIPYDYVTNTDLSDDFWTIRKINETDGY